MKAPVLSRKVQKWNRKTSINNFLSQFKIKFDMKEDAIDLREMARNFPNEVIPVQSVHEAILAVIGPTYQVTTTVDPSGGATIHYPVLLKEYFDYVSWDQLYLWPIFQRDVAPNHVEKIYRDFDPSSVIVPCLIKITLTDNKVIYCIWDGHHTVQVCRLEGYEKFPAWIIDVDQFSDDEIVAAGFPNTDTGRIQFGCFIAGKNMRRINGLNKRPLSPYDDFLIGYETRDPKFVAMMNILRKHSCVVKRHATCAGAFTQIKSGIECYDLKDSSDTVGRFWDRALKFHRTLWPQAPLVLEIFRPLSYLYQLADLQGFTLDASFDKELGDMLVTKYGDPESAQEGIKESYWRAYGQPGKLNGIIPEHDKFRVLSGLINMYIQNGGKHLLPAAPCQWRV